MTTSIASADELHAQTSVGPKPAYVSRKDMSSATDHAPIDGTAIEGPGALPSPDDSLSGNPPRSSWWREAGVLIASIARRHAEARRRSRNMRALYTLNDRMLADMGLLRSEIMHAGRHGIPRRR